MCISVRGDVLVFASLVRVYIYYVCVGMYLRCVSASVSVLVYPTAHRVVLLCASHV